MYATYKLQFYIKTLLSASELISDAAFVCVNAIYAGKDIKPGNLKRLRSIAKKLGVPVYQQTLNQSNNGFDYISIKL